MNKNRRFLLLLFFGCWLLVGLASALPIYVSPLSGGELNIGVFGVRSLIMRGAFF